ncbi:sugar ABC transporter permease [Clostridia bacterium]|nr:sugar ABC transporter permease [Clostridia bacterium]
MENGLTISNDVTVKTAPQTRKRRKSALSGNVWQLHALLLLPMAFLVLFNLVPIAGLRMAFLESYNYRLGIWGSPWGGLTQFRYMFTVLPEFWTVFRNTLVIAVAKLVFGFPVPIAVALLLNEMRSKKTKKAIQTAIYLPYFISWVVMGGILKNIFQANGFFDRFLGVFGYTPSTLWLQSNSSFVPILVVSEIWKGFGFGTIIYLAALTGVDPNLYEAAEIDGANRVKQTLHITLPAMMPVVILNLILNLGGILNAGFEQIFVLYSQKVYDTADIIDTYVYRLTFGQGTNYPLGTAIGLFKSVIAFILIGGTNLVLVKKTDYRIF